MLLALAREWASQLYITDIKYNRQPPKAAISPPSLSRSYWNNFLAKRQVQLATLSQKKLIIILSIKPHNCLRTILTNINKTSHKHKLKNLKHINTQSQNSNTYNNAFTLKTLIINKLTNSCKGIFQSKTSTTPLFTQDNCLNKVTIIFIIILIYNPS